MTDPAPPATPTTPDTPATPAATAAANATVAIAEMQKAFIEETGDNMENLSRMRVEEDPVTRQLAQEIIDRMALLSRRFDMKYTGFFPLNVCEFLLLAKWQHDAPRLVAFIGDEENEGDAKAQLDILYA